MYSYTLASHYSIIPEDCEKWSVAKGLEDCMRNSCPQEGINNLPLQLQTNIRVANTLNHA